MTTRSPITTHVLDVAVGKPARGVSLRLDKREGDTFRELARGATDDDGRATTLLAPGSLEAGTYRIEFGVADYFARRGETTFYPRVAIEFEVVATNEHYHVPLLVSPFGYSTYRGS